MTCLDQVLQDASPRRVAIVRSGPGGLVVAKYLKEHGFEPVVFEQADDIGGQWNVRGPSSGVWPSMVTNTSRFSRSAGTALENSVGLPAGEGWERPPLHFLLRCKRCAFRTDLQPLPSGARILSADQQQFRRQTQEFLPPGVASQLCR